jgi:hypothetical protein
VNYQDESLFQTDGTPLNFYLPADVPFNRIQSYSDLVQTLSENEGTQWLFQPHLSLPEKEKQLREWCQPEFSALPDRLAAPLEKISSFQNWTLFRCRSPSLLRTTLEEQQDSQPPEYRED